MGRGPPCLCNPNPRLARSPLSQEPAPRGRHTGTYIPEFQKLYVYGGYGGGGRTYKEIDAYDTETLTWAPLQTKGNPPAERFDHTASLAGQKLVIIGGRNNDGPVEQMCTLDTETSTWEVRSLHLPSI